MVLSLVRLRWKELEEGGVEEGGSSGSTTSLGVSDGLDERHEVSAQARGVREMEGAPGRHDRDVLVERLVSKEVGAGSVGAEGRASADTQEVERG